MTRPGYFNIKKDTTFSYFCQGCLVGKTEEQMSKRDIRYCLDCQPFIEQEYALLSEKRQKELYKPVGHIETYAPIEKTKMSTLNSPRLKVDIFRPRGRPTTYKKCQLPVEEIKQLSKERMGAKAIATKLRKEYDIKVSYKTIQRVLSGERRDIGV